MKMRNLCLIYDSGVTNNEKMIIVNTLAKAAKIFGNRKFINLGKDPMLNGNKRISADMIVARSTRVKIGQYGAQYDAGDIWQQVFDCPKQQKSHFYCLFVTSKDITVKLSQKYLNFCFGYTLGNIAIISTARTKDLSDGDRNVMLTGLIMHELGHAFGLAMGGRSNSENNLGVHCTNPNCVMNQGLIRKDLINNFRRAFKKGCYCEQCWEQARLTFD